MITKAKRKKEKGKVISTIKKRIVFNLKRSGVAAVAVKGERPELPRVLDVVFSSLELLRRRRNSLGKGSRQIILDFANAFFQFPGRADERRFFATRLGKAVLVWLRTAQGSRGARLICGKALALVMRLAAGTIDHDAMNASTYVDDPLVTFVGDQADQDLNIAKNVGSILAMGFSLSFPKAQDSDVERVVTWTSARMELIVGDDPGIKVSIKEYFSPRWPRTLATCSRSTLLVWTSCGLLPGARRASLRCCAYGAPSCQCGGRRSTAHEAGALLIR